jgi:tyrosyl-tRNA synthetase
MINTATTTNKPTNQQTCIDEFISRGYLHQCSDIDALRARMDKGPIVLYVGLDATAKSLHVGNLMQIMILRLFQRYGHKPIVIVGGGTTRIGDPSGKDESRKMITTDEINGNIAGIKKGLAKFLSFGSNFESGIEHNNASENNAAIILNNDEWLGQIRYIDFLSEYGSIVSVNRMLTMDSVRLRLEREQNLSFLEFNYMLLQGYDFVTLRKKYNCELQIGGSDQWGNMVTGVDMTRRVLNKQVFCLTTPLLTTSSGNKMGKSVNGAVWLNEDMLSPYEYYQYWRNTEDPDVLKFSKLYCEYNDDEQMIFNNLIVSDINQAKSVMAYRLTSLCHGKDAADGALSTAINIFENKGVGADMPVFTVEYDRIVSGIKVIDLLYESALCSSKSEAKQLIKGGGAKVNNITVIEESMIVNDSFLIEGDNLKLSAGI